MCVAYNLVQYDGTGVFVIETELMGIDISINIAHYIVRLIWT